MNIKGSHIIFYKLADTHDDVNKVILLSKRTLNAPVFPGYWSLFGGKVDENENPIEALKREILEELEIDGFDSEELNIEHLCYVPISRKASNTFISYYFAQLEVDMARLRLKRDKNDFVEGDGLAWFNAEEIHHLSIRPEDRIALTTYFQEHGT